MRYTFVLLTDLSFDRITGYGWQFVHLIPVPIDYCYFCVRIGCKKTYRVVAKTIIDFVKRFLVHRLVSRTYIRDDLFGTTIPYSAKFEAILVF